MKIGLVCAKCKKPLIATLSNIDVQDNIIMYVPTCTNLDCRNCSDCEVDQKFEKEQNDNVALTNRIIKADAHIAVLKDEVKCLKEEVKRVSKIRYTK